MARRLDVRFLLWSLAIVTTLTFATFGLHRWQVQRNAGVYLREAQRAFDKGLMDRDFGLIDRALTHFSHYLTHHPDDLEALTKYSDALDAKAAQTGDLHPLIRTLERILWRDPDRDDIRHRLILTLIANRRYREAQDHLDKLIPKWPRPAELVHIKGWCQNESAATSQGYAQAVASFAKAVELDPTYLQSYVLWADVLQNRLHQPDEVDAVMTRMVTANARNPEAYLIRARFRGGQDQQELADQDLREALHLAPTDSGVLLAAAEAAQAAGKLAESLAYLQQGSALYPDRPEFLKARANLAVRTGDRAEAILLLRRGVKDFPEAWDMHILLIDVLIDEKQLAEASTILAELGRAGVNPSLPNYLQARLHIERGTCTDAIALLEHVRRALGSTSEWSSRVNALLGVCYEQIGDFEQQVAAFRRAVQQEPGWTAARVGLAAALIRAQRPDEALVELQALPRTASPPPSVYPVIERALRFWLERRRFEDADHALLKVEQRLPLTPELARLGAEAAQGLRRPARALQLAALAASPDATDYRDLLWLGRMHAWAGDVKTADRLFRRAIVLAGHAPDAWIALADHLSRSGQSTTGDGLVQQMKRQVPAILAPYTLARCLEALGRFDEAQAAYEQALATPEVDFALLFAAADYYRRAEKGPQAAALWRKLLDPETGTPGDMTARTRRHLAVYLSSTGNPQDFTTAQALLKENVKNFGDTLADQRAGAVVLGSQPGQRRAARRAFEETLTKQPAAPDEILLLAQLHDADDEDFSRVHELLTDALPPGQEAPHILAYFVRTLLNHGEIDDARTRFSLLERLDPTSARTRELRELLKKAGRG